MKIAGLVKVSLVDYPGELAATIFTSGCNLRCPFCHNPSLVLENNSDDLYAQTMQYLSRRKGVLGGVCVSGGEPLLHKDIQPFLASIKELGYKIKLDTNGCFPSSLMHLINHGLIDYVAMDIKSSPKNYSIAVGFSDFDIANIEKSLQVLARASIPFEIRTTLVKELHSADVLNDIGAWLHGFITTQVYYLQNFASQNPILNDSTNSLASLTPLLADEMLAAKQILSHYISNVVLRGV